MTGEDYELEKIKAELTQERQMKEMLDQSTTELQLTVSELEKRIDTPGVIDGESNSLFDNEWKTRYEMQVELNQQLTKQIGSLAEKIQEAKDTYNKSKQPKSNRDADNTNELTPYNITLLEREKISLNGQLRDLEWRLDQESKAYHKANEDRKQHLLDINAIRNNFDHGSHRLGETPRAGHLNMNIPQDHRIIDPRYGPVKRTAAVKNLPRLN
ncbi:hypothetical protein LSH36_510g03047 [Paralvinella palmiformis]|uniref:Uncharacterized protein n=1 Tax=Paralvinella palmiformis TaxID=53620 RepID=A0AAD9MWD9_9ANNE|nr:hypothetical protein LSH36_510g03047 [Paralvinella palmiformis]